MKNTIRSTGTCLAAFMLVSCGGGSSPSPTTLPTPTNTAPVLSTANQDQTATVGAEFSYDATMSGSTFSDADGDTLTFTVSYSPGAQGLTDSGGVIGGTPSLEGTVTVTITANDGNGGQVSDTFDIVISPSASSATDISGVTFSNMSPACPDYVGAYEASSRDVARDLVFDGTLDITSTGGTCTFTSNSIPNHDFNDGDIAFPNLVGPVTETFSFTTTPIAAATTTALSLTVDNAILLNGVKVDVLAAACFGVGNERIGCNDINQPWRFDPMHGPNGFNVDMNNAHTQPDGAYHYHGPPPIQNGDVTTASGVVGFAADGFPIFGSFFEDGSTIREVEPSYRLRTGSRPSGTGNPGGTYDGQYRDDYEFVDGLGDLDACNGMTVDGQYGYYVTEAFPYLMACFTGTPDPSFNK